MRRLLPEVETWVERLPQTLTEHLRIEGISAVKRNGKDTSTHLVYKGFLNDIPLVIKLPNPMYLSHFLPEKSARDVFYLSYWQWVHRSALHHMNVARFGKSLVPRLHSSMVASDLTKPYSRSWIPGFGTLWDACSELIENNEQYESLSDTSHPWFPVTISEAVNCEPFLPKTENKFGFFKRAEDVFSFGLRLCQLLEALETKKLRLLDLDSEHLVLDETGDPIFLGHARMIVTTWEPTDCCKFGGGLTDGCRPLFDPGSAWYLCPTMHGDWRDYLPKISNFLTETAAYVANTVRDGSSAQKYKEAGRSLSLPAEADIHESSLVGFWHARFCTVKPNRIRKKPHLTVSHFIDVENCRWSVLGMIIDFSALITNVEMFIARDVKGLPTSKGHRWAVTPNWAQPEHNDWWKRAFERSGIEHVRTEGDYLPGQEADDRKLIELLTGKSENREIVVLYTSEGGHYCEAVKKILVHLQTIKIWIVGFGEMNSDWHILGNQFQGRLVIIDVLAESDLIACVKGEF